ncbi:hypothetical protein A3F66_00240 [candidate division TM6 bacterium RIFCSPHIGHO2_12_FULL_32_22]|nr:MAG: hypothetical protein A3F66_00240 [candidate division TM6 bacterium RIFCSPHIGHO2_12_FULL_32_22]
MKKKLIFYIIFSLFAIPLMETQELEAKSSLNGMDIAVISVGSAAGALALVILAIVVVGKIRGWVAKRPGARLKKYIEWLKLAESKGAPSDKMIVNMVKDKLGEPVFKQLLTSKNLEQDFPELSKVFDRFKELEDTVSDYARSLNISDDDFFEFSFADGLFDQPGHKTMSREEMLDLICESGAKALLTKRNFPNAKGAGILFDLKYINKLAKEFNSKMYLDLKELTYILRNSNPSSKFFEDVVNVRVNLDETLGVQRSTITIHPETEEVKTEIGKNSLGQIVYADKDGNLYIKTDSGMENLLLDENVYKDGYKFEKMGKSGKAIYRNDIGKSFELQADGTFKSVKTVAFDPVEQHEPIEGAPISDPVIRDPVAEF